MSCCYDKGSPLYPQLVYIFSTVPRRKAGKSRRLRHMVFCQQLWQHAPS